MIKIKLLSFILVGLNLNPGKGTFGTPHDSISGVPPKAAMIVAVGFLLFIFYVAYRVRKSMKEDRKREAENDD